MNDDASLEKEADLMGLKAFQSLINHPEAIDHVKLKENADFDSHNSGEEKVQRVPWPINVAGISIFGAEAV